AAADLGTVRLPAAWASPHQLVDPADAVGRRAAVALVAGAPVMDAEVSASAAPEDARELALRLGEAAHGSCSRTCSWSRHGATTPARSPRSSCLPRPCRMRSRRRAKARCG